MVKADIIFNYFPELSEVQKERFRVLEQYYAWHNEKVNVISRKDMDQFYLRHVLHSLAIVRFCPFTSGQNVVDIGTGGGFPGIPLAIMLPEVQFTLVDSIGKKIRVVNDVISQLELTNAMAVNSRTESIGMKFDIATARAVAPMTDLWRWMKGHWKQNPRFYLLKGGDLAQEMQDLLSMHKGARFNLHNISEVFNEDFFETKKVIEIY